MITGNFFEMATDTLAELLNFLFNVLAKILSDTRSVISKRCSS